ncbi:phosphoglycolate phosphatase, bacterial [Azospira sp. I13]|uniref:phosphoglycolate phosphatase n=1 Tax=Azospira sp. I13 TaxID=1765050 RepID=UPI000D49C6AD|nr:phosphoglycolate phosphatase [Azospira sp. I13]GBG02526.1 phosphoglycolate phosphatase, bacterial [Azospira sp. I13]
MRLRAATFDLDGTLVDSIPDLAAACHAMLAELGQPPRTDGDIHRFVGKGMAVLVERCLTWDVVPEATLLEAGIAAFRKHYAEINGRASTVYPGVVAGLEAFRALDLPLGVVTNKPAAFTGPLLERMGLAGYFDVVVSGDTLAFKKPRPEPLLHACARLGVAPDLNLHVGDSHNDIESARAASCPVICVPYGYNEGRPVDSADCDALVSDLVAAARWAAGA